MNANHHNVSKNLNLWQIQAIVRHQLSNIYALATKPVSVFRVANIMAKRLKKLGIYGLAK